MTLYKAIDRQENIAFRCYYGCFLKGWSELIQINWCNDSALARIEIARILQTVAVTFQKRIVWLVSQYGCISVLLAHLLKYRHNYSVRYYYYYYYYYYYVLSSEQAAPATKFNSLLGVPYCGFILIYDCQWNSVKENSVLRTLRLFSD